MSEPIQIEPRAISFDVPDTFEIKATEMGTDFPVHRYARAMASAPQITVAMRYEAPPTLARLGDENLYTLRSPRLKMGPRGLRVRFRGRVVAMAEGSITMCPTGPAQQLRFRDSKGWRRHIRRAKAAERRAQC